MNEYGAKAVRENPSRFGFFASLPIPHMEACLEELAYALDELGAAGVTLQANMHGMYLGEDQYEAVWAELDKRGAVSYLFAVLLATPGAASAVISKVQHVPLQFERGHASCSDYFMLHEHCQKKGVFS